MKPTVAADEMFPEGVGPYMDLEEAGGPSNLLMDLAANEKAVHGDFFNVMSLSLSTKVVERIQYRYPKTAFSVPDPKTVLHVLRSNAPSEQNDFEDLFDDEDLK